MCVCLFFECKNEFEKKKNKQKKKQTKKHRLLLTFPPFVVRQIAAFFVTIH